jgi:quercetin dioxygenase-like cupin family protein
MFCRVDKDGYREMIEGIRMKTLVHGDKTLLCEFRLAKGSILPPHDHPHEQTGYLVSGKLVFTVDGERFEAGPGDSWCIPGNTKHSAETMMDSVAVEVFSPVREDYLPKV